MEPVKLLWGLALLAAAAVADVRERRVPNRLLLLGLAGRGALYAAELLTGPEEFGAVLLGDLAQAGAAVAVLALAAAASRGALGFGDVKLLGVVCLCCGLRWTFWCFAFGMAAAAAASIWLLAVKKVGRKHRLALVPYFLAGYVLTAAVWAPG